VPDRTKPHYAPHYSIVRALVQCGSSALHFPHSALCHYDGTIRSNSRRRLISPLCLALTVRANILFKLENRNWTRLVQKPNWTETQGQKWKCVLR